MQVGSSTGKKSTITMKTADFYLFFLIQKDPLEPNSGEYKGNSVAGFFFFLSDYSCKFPVSVPSASLNTAIFLKKNSRNTGFIHLCLKHSRDKNLRI